MYRRPGKFFKKKTVTPPPIIPIFTLSDEYKALICSQSYIGKKGYTIPKSIIDKADVEQFLKDLNVKPMLFGPNQPDTTPFPVFRENTNKYYLPRFYGIQRYGMPAKIELQLGTDISVDFEKPLRDYQDSIVGIYVDYVKKAEHGCSGGILEVPCGRGKTVMGLKIISLLKKKTLILVHKEFLMNQWIERIGEFLPTARVGKIQASTFDIADKDIVIGMIQTLYDKEYPQGTFDSFGLTIVDEVHRIGSEQFSRTLFKTITPFMLGISATVDRKDKLTRVLYMFIGEKIYTEKRDNDDLVCVRAIEYKSNDPTFNEVEVDFRGNTKYSTMIVKLCEFGPRSDFIIRVIGDLLEESENQIMVLCHNRSLLTYLYESICHKKLATVGFYVGGMKQANLQETEEKQIVLATYAMAAEALDIKTLASLVMITPKTDITQSVGRILRVKHDSPIIVDIIDTHEVFQNQWTQRKRFYKKCNYRIQQTDSRIYTSDWSNAAIWKTVFEPKNSTNNSHNKEIGEDSDGETGPDGVTSKFTPKPIGKCLIDTSIFANLE
uniref:Helicase ATP-binding domain-containing protein n=1 Tax=viral metagenome TaxID=1070528 RepID=A0A6C0JGT8_9ZZZZ